MESSYLYDWERGYFIAIREDFAVACLGQAPDSGS